MDYNQLLCVSSDTGTIHIFSTGIDQNNENVQNKFAFWGKLLIFHQDYANSEWSFSQVRISEKCAKCYITNDCKYIIIITENKKYYKAEINYKGGNCKIIEEKTLD